MIVPEPSPSPFAVTTLICTTLCLNVAAICSGRALIAAADRVVGAVAVLDLPICVPINNPTPKSTNARIRVATVRNPPPERPERAGGVGGGAACACSCTGCDEAADVCFASEARCAGVVLDVGG